MENKEEFNKRLAAVEVFVKHLGDDALYYGRKTDFENAMLEYGDHCAQQKQAEFIKMIEGEIVKYQSEFDTHGKDADFQILQYLKTRLLTKYQAL